MIRPFFVCDRALRLPRLRGRSTRSIERGGWGLSPRTPAFLLGTPTPTLPRQSGRGRRRTLRRRQLLRREAAVERLALRRHLLQEFRRGEARAVFGLELVAQRDEILRPHEVDIGQRAAGKRRKAEAEDRTDIGFAHVG